MKRLSLLFALSFVLLSFGLADAIEFQVTMDPSFQFYNPVYGGDFYRPNTHVEMELKMRNNDLAGSLTQPDSLIDWCGYSMTVRLYGTQGGVEVPLPMSWENGGGSFPSVALERANGWEMSGAGSVWSSKNEFVVTSWPVMVAGPTVLPDTLNHTTIGCIGDPPDFPGGWVPYAWNEDPPYSGTWVMDYPNTAGTWPGDQGLLTRMIFHFSVPLSEPDTASICIDQSDWNTATRDWLFSPAQDFGGPYCFPFSYIPNLPPEVIGTPLSLTTEHDVAYDETYDITDNEQNAVTGVGAVDENGDPLGTATLVGGGTQIHWTYDPPCSWVTDGESHVVKLYAEDNVNGHLYPAVELAEISLEVTNTGPAIVGPCPRGTFVAAIDALFSHTFVATDDNSGDTKSWSISAVTGGTPTGLYDIVDGVFTFTPASADDGASYVFTVMVTDCAGATATCNLPIDCSSLFPFGILIEYEDGNNNPAKGGVDGFGHYLGQHAYVDVYKVMGTELMYGFDFMIAYDNSALAFMGAYGNPTLFDIPGQYEWEYFTYRFVDNCGGSCPSGLAEIVAIADQNDGMHTPSEFILPPDNALDDPAEWFTLFTMDFFVSNDYTLECSFVPISFYWTDCTDNSIAYNYRSNLLTFPLCVKQAVSRDVFAFAGFDPLTDEVTYAPITNFGGTFPTFYGAPDDPCDPIGSGDSRATVCEGLDAKFPVRFIDFFNGGIKIICSDDIDDRGDINLNGVKNEIADAVVFTNYFIYGMAAFTINEQGQKAATDVNADGIPLSVADLVYLIRVIIGDVLPIDKLNPDMVNAKFGHVGELVSVDVELGAALFVFEGNVDVSLAQDASHMELKTGVVDGNTHALVYSFDKGATFSGNILNTSGTLVSVEAADYFGSKVITDLLPTSFSVKNYPNPFNAATTIEMALPVASNWNLTIYNVAGQKVAEFAGYAEAGVQDVVWDASAVASGIYFYKVTTDQGSLTKKMVLLK